jgi:hypothetical protein
VKENNGLQQLALVKELSIPKLELMAVLIGVNILKLYKVKSIFQSRMHFL